MSELEKLVEEAARKARPDLWEIPEAYESLGWPAQEREKVRKIARIAYAAGRKAGREEAASAMDAKAAQLRKYASEDRSRNNPAGGIWNDTRAVEVRNYAAAIRALPEG